MNQKDKVLSLLGLAAKAGKVASGEFSVEKAVKEHKAYLVIIAEDASDNTKKHFSDMCIFHNTERICYKDKSSLGHAIGKQERASLALLDEGFAKALQKHLQSSEASVN